MRCRNCRELLAVYADGQLGAAAGNGIAAHLASCAGCTSLLDRERQTRRLLALVGEVNWTPPDLRLRIARAISSPSHRGRRRAPAALGAILGVAALTLGLLHGGFGSLQVAAPDVPTQSRHVEDPGSRPTVHTSAGAVSQARSRYDPLLAEQTLAYSAVRTITYPPLPPDWPDDTQQAATSASKGGEAHPARATSHYTLLAY